MTRAASIKKKDLNLAAGSSDNMVSDSIHRDDICKISKLQDQEERDSVRVKVGVLFSELLLLQSEPENIITIFAVTSQSQSFGKLREKKFNKNERTSNGKTSV